MTERTFFYPGKVCWKGGTFLSKRVAAPRCQLFTTFQCSIGYNASGTWLYGFEVQLKFVQCIVIVLPLKSQDQTIPTVLIRELKLQNMLRCSKADDAALALSWSPSEAKPRTPHTAWKPHCLQNDVTIAGAMRHPCNNLSKH
jgi:hypothetical protein